MKPQRGSWEAVQPMFQTMLGEEQPEESLTAGDWAMVAFIVAVVLVPLLWKLWP